jgi:hypothetical protein
MSRLQLNDSNHESYEGTQLRQIKYIVNCTEQTTEGIQATYMELLEGFTGQPLTPPKRPTKKIIIFVIP